MWAWEGVFCHKGVGADEGEAVEGGGECAVGGEKHHAVEPLGAVLQKEAFVAEGLEVGFADGEVESVDWDLLTLTTVECPLAEKGGWVVDGERGGCFVGKGDPIFVNYLVLTGAEGEGQKE